jgi:hypothetical protein
MFIPVERQIIETQVNQGADLDIGNAGGTPQLHALVIEFNRPRDRAELAAKPPEGVGEMTDNKRVPPLLRLGHAFVRHGKCLGVLSSTPAGLAQEGQRAQLGEPIVDGPGEGHALLTEVRRDLKLPLLVSHHAAKHQRMRQGVLVPLPPADPQGLGEFPVRFREVPPHMIHGSEADKAAGQSFLIPGLPGQPKRLLGMLFDEGGARFREGQPMHIRQMPQTFPFFCELPEARASWPMC